jgi:3'(2'), 5'-bisphosphate nucleotidase
MDYAAVVATARRLAIEAGRAILEVYDRPDFSVRTKSDASPITEADEAADALISAGLRAAFPGTALVTEEQTEGHGRRTRCVLHRRPLDGTKEFVQRRGDFTVNIALCRERRADPRRRLRPRQGRLFYTDAARPGGRGDRRP